jgi:transcription initiation factor TFIID subunit 11
VQAQWDKYDDEAKEKLPDLPEEAKGQLKMPLLPEHLVEALRRHRLSKEGASTGQLGLWQLQQHSGVERFSLKTGGKRLFK